MAKTGCGAAGFFIHHAFIKTIVMEQDIVRNISHLLSLSARAQCKHTRGDINMSNRFMISVAAIALIAGAGAANAQGTGMKGDSGGAAAQHSAPSGGAAAPADRGSAQPSGAASEKAAPTEAAPGAAKGQRAEETAPGQKSKGTSAQTDTKGGKDMKAEGREGQNGNMKAEGRENNNMKAEGREKAEGRDNGKMNAETREGRDNGKTNAETKTGGDRTQTTTGQAGAGAKISTEQRTKITSVIRSEHVSPVTNVNFNISVGTRIPHDVSYHVLPSEVVTIYPEWRGYNYVLVRDQILVIDPQTFEIVAILDV
jgi:hypothetical protein